MEDEPKYFLYFLDTVNTLISSNEMQMSNRVNRSFRDSSTYKV